jgi:hypothetical protein
MSESGKTVRTTFRLTPPAGAPYPSAVAEAFLYGAFLDGNHPKWSPGLSVDLRIHDLPCPTWGWGQDSPSLALPSRQFYAVYASTVSLGRVRLMSFTPNCLGQNETIGPPLPADLPWFTEEITVEVFLEADDGLDGGILVLRGSATAE